MPGLTEAGDGFDHTREALGRLLATETDPVRQVVAAIGLAADDADVGWRSLAEDLDRAVAAVDDERHRRSLRRIRNKTIQLARAGAALARDVDQHLEHTAVDSEVGR